MVALTDKAKEIADAQPDLKAVPDAPKTVTEAIARVMAELPAIGKSRNPDGGISYAYRGIEAITGEVQALFGKYGVVFVPRVLSHEIKDLTVNGKPWTDTILMVEYDVFGPSNAVRTTFTEKDGTTILGMSLDYIKVGPLLAIGRDNSDKGANKAMTQAFKYALLQVLCISDKKDDVDGATHEADARYVPPAPDPEAEEMMHELGEMVKAFPTEQRDTLQSHLRGKFGPSNTMTLPQIRDAIAIAAGWPETGEPQQGELT